MSAGSSVMLATKPGDCWEDDHPYLGDTRHLVHGGQAESGVTISVESRGD